MNRASLTAPLLVLLGASCLAFAQQPEPPGWMPPAMQGLETKAAFHTDFTFDRAMLQMAGGFTGEPEVQSAIGKLNSISVHSYHYAQPGLYDPMALESARAEFSAAGFEHLVSAGAGNEPLASGRTDLWLSFAHMQVTGMVLMIQRPRDLEVVTVDGLLSPIDLLHLRGHFGIPQFTGDRFVPAPGSPAPPPDQSPAASSQTRQPPPAAN